jgi:hypothetical protein
LLIKSHSVSGHVTLPNHEGEYATHVLVIMLGGITSRWKQAVAYFFSPDSVDGAVLGQIVKDVIIKAAEIHLDVVSVTTDMGASNQAMWK